MTTDLDLIVRLATLNDVGLFSSLEEDVFDEKIDEASLRENLADPRHHLAIAISKGVIVGMAVGIHYIQPDKCPQFFIDEMGVSAAYQRRGIGTQLLNLLLDQARALGCKEAWVATEKENTPARSLYASVRGSQLSSAMIYTFPL
jgi:aminoglycoside 6'-N-acetyltransferase I